MWRDCQNVAGLGRCPTRRAFGQRVNATTFGRRAMRHPIAAVSVALVVVVAGVGTSPAGENKIDRSAGCVENSALIGSCFTVQGRALMSNGTPGFRIMWTGTKRVLGVLPAEDEIVPACLAKAVTATSEVTGEFVVCPFSVAKEGHMQMVCVQSVGEFTARRWSSDRRAYVTEGRAPGCSLPSKGAR